LGSVLELLPRPPPPGLSRHPQPVDVGLDAVVQLGEPPQRELRQPDGAAPQQPQERGLLGVAVEDDGDDRVGGHGESIGRSVIGRTVWCRPTQPFTSPYRAARWARSRTRSNSSSASRTVTAGSNCAEHWFGGTGATP